MTAQYGTYTGAFSQAGRSVLRSPTVIAIGDCRNDQPAAYALAEGRVVNVILIGGHNLKSCDRDRVGHEPNPNVAERLDHSTAPLHRV